MSRKPDNLEELLNAKLDNELADEERSQVDEALREEQARGEYESLKEVSSLLKNHFQTQAVNSLSSGFTERVVAACEAARVEREEAVKPAAVSEVRGSNATIWVIASVLAASVALVAFLPGLLAPSGSNEMEVVQADPLSEDPGSAIVENVIDTPETNPSLDPTELVIPDGDDTVRVEYVSEMQFPAIMYLLEVDIEASASAIESNKIEAILKKHGVDPKKPLAANEDMRQVIEQARMNGGAEGDTSNAYIHLVRAPIRNLGAALDEIYSDKVSFPNVKFALGFDTPNVGLFKSLLKNSGTRFASDEPFMAPISAGDSGRASPFRGVGSEGKLVSSSKRSQGFGQLNMVTLDPSKSEAIENLILFVRFAE
ncbi:MAG: hypothetical protein AAGG44_00700 [Planctomycetota bacterium]